MDSTAPDPGLFRSGRRIDKYILRERIGEGGMGEVWRAEQAEPVRRVVALKLIKHGMDSSQILARFEAERQALAMMDHPCIASVIDAGTTPEGRPYFAMEYVRGIPITDYADQRRLSMEERLRLFQLVCSGVQHAHQKAILHRDLKPSNVLVADLDGRPQPKIIDFGVAKAITQKLSEKTVHTHTGQFIGTPEYVSPEQADLTVEDIDTRADVYSLGVILYVLLSGSLPFGADAFRGHDSKGIVRILREKDPPRPSTRLSSPGTDSAEVARRRRVRRTQLISELEGDLDWIVMRCFEKDRNRRYGSAQEVAQDIERYFEHEPVHAHPPSITYRVRKFARRHRLGVGVASGAAAVLVAFALSMAVQSAKIAAERDRANQEAQLAGEVSGFLTQLFKIADPSQSRGNSITAREVLDRGAERIAQTEWSDPRVQSRLISIMGEVYAGLGLSEDAHQLYEQAWRLRETHHGPLHPETLQAHAQFGASLLARGRYAESESVLREVRHRQREVLGGDDPALAATTQTLARLLRNTGRSDEAEPLYKQVLAARRARMGPDALETAETMNQLGILYWSESRYEEAEPLLEHSLAVAETRLGADHPTTLVYRNNMAAFDHSATHWPDPRPYRVRAEKLYREVLESQRRILGSEHPETLRTIYNLSSLLLTLDRLEDARPFTEEAVDGRRRVLGEGHRATLLAQNNLARLWRFTGREEEAEALLEEVLERQRKILEPSHREIYFTLTELFEICQGQGRDSEARVYLSEILSIDREQAQAPHASAAAHDRYAWSLLTCPFVDLQDHATALSHARKANELSHGENPTHLRTLARAEAMNGDPAQAQVTLERALSILADEHPDRAEYVQELAEYRSES